MEKTIAKLDQAIEYACAVFGIEVAFVIGLIYGQALV